MSILDLSESGQDSLAQHVLNTVQPRGVFMYDENNVITIPVLFAMKFLPSRNVYTLALSLLLCSISFSVNI